MTAEPTPPSPPTLADVAEWKKSVGEFQKPSTGRALWQIVNTFVPYGLLWDLSYVQHQFEDVYWERTEEWDYTAAALQGSSFYKLPKILQWFSGNIGFHHIHHLSSRIPNYNLERCHQSHPLFRNVKPITMRSSLKSLPLRLWDDKLKKLVGFRHLRKLRRDQKRYHPS